MVLLAIASLAIGVLLTVGVRVVYQNATPETIDTVTDTGGTAANLASPLAGSALPQVAATDRDAEPTSLPLATGETIPDAPETTATTTHILYRVRRGDTLWAIAEALTGNPYDCWNLWPDRTPHGEDLEVGTMLEVPISALTVAPDLTRD